jgi:DNA replication protein DnaC
MKPILLPATMGNVKADSSLTSIGSIVEYVMRLAPKDGAVQEPEETVEEPNARRVFLSRLRSIEKMDVRVSQHMREQVASGNVDPVRAIKAVRRWVQTSIPILVLCGSVGTGKTVAIAEAGAILGGGLCVSPTRLYRECRSENTSTAIYKSHLVALDDLGIEHLSGPFMEVFQDWIDMRRVFGRTLISTNLNPRALQLRYGDRVWDRLRSDGVLVELSGASMRKGAV